MDDYEAYGQLRDAPAGRERPPGRTHPAGRARPPGRVQPGAPPEALAPARPAAPTRRRSHWLRNITFVAVAYFVIAVVTMVQPFAVPFTSARLSAPFPGGAPLLFGLPDRPFTVLVIGLDRRPGNEGASRTDTVLVLRIDPGGHKAAFLSIPRDSLMAIPDGDGGYFQDRINTAFVYNYDSEDESAAPAAVAETIEHNLGIAIDHYVIFDQYNAKDLIDAMGGVTIANPRAFGQDDYSDDDVNVIPQWFGEGTIKLNGYEAVAYGRIRQGSTDFDRIERQQRVGAALIDQAASPMAIFRLPSAYGAYKGAVDSDMSLRQSAGVLSLLKRVPEKDLQTKSLGEAAVSCSTCSASIQLLDPARTQQIIAEAFGDPDAGARASELLLAAGVTP